MPPEPPKRRRGAPHGNKNALKHGFYSRQFKKADLVDLESADFIGLKDEITMLRVYIRRVIDLGNDVNDLTQAISLLRVLCLASASLMRLLKTQYLLGAQTDKYTVALREIYEELSAMISYPDELRRKNPPKTTPTS